MDLDTLAFNLGMVETISYWKTACPAVLRVDAGPLDFEQVAWWHDLYLNGLGEFFLQNEIDFTAPDFLTIVGNVGEVPRPIHVGGSSDLVLVGGGKDSALVLDLMKTRLPGFATLTLNPILAADRLASLAQSSEHIAVGRTIDPAMLTLNKLGYLNGHTPFSAYLAFLGVLVASIWGFKNVVVANEAGASAGQATFLGRSINHQYSKGLRFEELFRGYSMRYLATDVNYFSLIRPIGDLQVSELFARLRQYHAAFRSCNVGQATDTWCGQCAKCAFVGLSLGAFLDQEEVDGIFGRDIFTSDKIESHLRDLVGLGDHIPFECVGTVDESRTALALLIRRRSSVPDAVRRVTGELGAQRLEMALRAWPALATSWGADGFIPESHRKALRDRL